MPSDSLSNIPPTEVLVVGAGPNGLAAAVAMAREGWPVTVLEMADTPGGGARSAELTLPGFTHDVCSAIHPLGAGSPFFNDLGLGVDWIHPPVPLAHPFDDGSVALLERDMEATGRTLGPDAAAWTALFAPLVDDWNRLIPEILAPPIHFPRHPLTLARFGMSALRSAVRVARGFEGKSARGLFAGMAGHSILPLETPGSAAFGLVLGAAGHAVGWPFPRGGTQKITESLVSCLTSMGGKLLTGRRVFHLKDLPPARTIFLDLTPRQVLSLAAERLESHYRRRLARYRYGPGVCKVDWALSGPIPWRAAECARAGTLHLGGALEEIAAAERAVWQGEHPERPFVILAQQSLFDPSRAPQGQHTGWAYCHVPHGSERDVSGIIEEQVERFAPGFRELIVARHVRTAGAFERYNPNYVGGDINGGVQDLRQLFARPAAREIPYATGAPGLYLCSSSTPPGGGVHGMCGFNAAQAALKAQYRL